MGSRFVAIVLLFIIGINSCNAIWCFSCSSYDKKECGDVFAIPISDSNYRSVCLGSCVKRRWRESSGSVSRVMVQRSCIIYRSEGCYSEKYGANQRTVNACACNTDDCNTSSKLKYSWFAVLLTACWTFIIYRNAMWTFS